jgi:hypothetical protein
MDLTDEKKGIMFRMLAKKPLYEAGLEFGLDKHYAKAEAVKAKMHRIYQEVQKDPDRYGISQEVVDTIVGIVSNRSITVTNPSKSGFSSGAMTLREKNELAENIEISDVVLSARDKTFKLLHKKLDQVGKNKKSLEAVSFSQLTTAAAILFDKGQIIQGQATENVAIMAKIDSNMSPEDALSAVLRMREANIIAKEAKS